MTRLSLRAGRHVASGAEQETRQNGHYLFTILIQAAILDLGLELVFRATPWMEGSNLKAGSHKMDGRKGRMGFSNAVACSLGVVSISRNQSGVVISFLQSVFSVPLTSIG